MGNNNCVEPSDLAAQILSKTHYGIGIYAHILRLYYPDQTVLSLSGRTCKPTENPFNENKLTLNVFIEKENVLGNELDNEFSCQREQNSNSFGVLSSAAENARSEFARHTDSENAIPAGDAFDFAELHYKLRDNELLQKLNNELHLHIGEKMNFYSRNNIASNSPKSPISPKVEEKGLVKVGDKVVFGKYAGTELTLDGKTYLVMNLDDLLGVL